MSHIALSVRVLFTRLCPAKWMNRSRCRLERLTLVDPRNHVLDEVEIPTRIGNFFRVVRSIKNIGGTCCGLKSAALLPISRMNVCPSSASAPKVSTATGKYKWLDDRLLYLAIYIIIIIIIIIMLFLNVVHKKLTLRKPLQV